MDAVPAKRKERRESAILSVISEDDDGSNNGVSKLQSTAGLSSFVEFEKKVSFLGRATTFATRR